MIRITIPHHLRTLANVTGELQLDVPQPVTITAIITTLEAKFPQLKGTIRDHGTQKRRPFIRFFGMEEDLSNDDPNAPLSAEISEGRAPFQIVGAIAGG